MDPVLIAVYRDLLARSGCSVDEVLCDPDLRTAFLSESRRRLGSDRAERDLLTRLSNLRKRSKLPRSRDLPTT